MAQPIIIAEILGGVLHSLYSNTELQLSRHRPGTMPSQEARSSQDHLVQLSMYQIYPRLFRMIPDHPRIASTAAAITLFLNHRALQPTGALLFPPASSLHELPNQ